MFTNSIHTTVSAQEIVIEHKSTNKAKSIILATIIVTLVAMLFSIFLNGKTTHASTLSNDVSPNNPVLTPTPTPTTCGIGAAYYEVEPNDHQLGYAANSLGTATRMTIHGGLTQFHDMDYFSFNATAGDRIWAYMYTGNDMGNTGDGDLMLLNSAHQMMQSDNENGSQGSRTAALANAPITATAAYYLRASTWNNTGVVNPYTLYYNRTSGASISESEPNDAMASADAYTLGSVRSGVFSSAADSDYYQFTAGLGDTIIFQYDSDPERNGTMTLGHFDILASNGSMVLSVNDSSPYAGEIRSNAAVYTFRGSNSTYYVKMVPDTLGGAGSTYAFHAFKAGEVACGPTPTATSTPTPFPTCGTSSNYVYTNAAGVIVPGSNLVPGSNEMYGFHQINLPFTYNFYGQPYNTVYAEHHGVLDFINEWGPVTNSELPTGYHGPSILPLWDSVITDDGYGPGFGIYTSTSGVAPNRIFNIEWRGCIYNFPSCSGNVNFEVRLYEGQNKFELVYGVVQGNGSTATVGVQKGWLNGQPLQSTEYSVDDGVISNGLRVLFTQAPCVTATATSTFTSTPTSTSTSTSTPASTSTPSMDVLFGHITFQGMPAQPNPRQAQPFALTLCQINGGQTANYNLSTDTNGLFALSPVSPGTYNWRVKSPKFLALSGTYTQQPGTTSVEMGLMKAGDANDDNRITVLDFNILKNTFGKGSADTGYDGRADFNGDNTVTAQDFNLVKGNFGQVGAPVNCQ